MAKAFLAALWLKLLMKERIMVQKIKLAALAGAFAILATPVLAEDIATPLGPLDIDPFHILSPAPAAAPAPAPAPMKKHHHKHMKKVAKK